MSQVRIFHNIARDADDRPVGMLDGYQAGHPLVKVARYQDHASDDVLLAGAFDLFNIGHDPAFGTPTRRALAYRAAGNRSLSVGDVVAIDGRFFSVARFGWDLITTPKWFAPADTVAHGTTGLFASSRAAARVTF